VSVPWLDAAARRSSCLDVVDFGVPGDSDDDEASDSMIADRLTSSEQRQILRSVSEHTSAVSEQHPRVSSSADPHFLTGWIRGTGGRAVRQQTPVQRTTSTWSCQKLDSFYPRDAMLRRPHLHGNVYIRVGVARALADSSNVRFLRFLRFPALNADEPPSKM